MMTKGWDDVRGFDDVVLKEERRLILKLEKEFKVRCSHLRKDGDFFYYCGLNLNDEDKTLGPFNPVYQRHVDLMELQLHCMDDFNGCCFYSGRLKR